ncbi:MAG: hypothetical protein ACM31E_05170 [Fibrobacterota bacterium]
MHKYASNMLTNASFMQSSGCKNGKCGCIYAFSGSKNGLCGCKNAFFQKHVRSRASILPFLLTGACQKICVNDFMSKPYLLPYQCHGKARTQTGDV